MRLALRRLRLINERGRKKFKKSTNGYRVIKDLTENDIMGGRTTGGAGAVKQMNQHN